MNLCRLVLVYLQWRNIDITGASERDFLGAAVYMADFIIVRRLMHISARARTPLLPGVRQCLHTGRR